MTTTQTLTCGFDIEVKMAGDASRRTNRADSIAPASVLRTSERERILVIDDLDDSRQRTVAILGDAGYQPFELHSAIGVTRVLLKHSIRAVVVDLGMPGVSGEKLIALLRQNPRLDGIVIVVVNHADNPHGVRPQRLLDADAVVMREQVETRLVPTMQRLLCSSGFHQKAPNLVG